MMANLYNRLKIAKKFNDVHIMLVNLTTHRLAMVMVKWLVLD